MLILRRGQYGNPAGYFNKNWTQCEQGIVALTFKKYKTSMDALVCLIELSQQYLFFQEDLSACMLFKINPNHHGQGPKMALTFSEA